jgi:hypothetical protein
MGVDGSGEGLTGMAPLRADACDPLGTDMPRQATDDQSKLLADMRGRVETAATEIERLTSELTARDQWVDELETIIDIVLGLLDTPVVIVGDDRRIRALSRGAGEQLPGDATVGRAFSSLIPDDVFAALEERLTAAANSTDGGDEAGAEPTSMPADVRRLPGGGAVVVLGAG